MTSCICTNRALGVSCVYPYCLAHVPPEVEAQAEEARETIAGPSSALEHRGNTIAAHEAKIASQERSILALVGQVGDLLTRIEALDTANGRTREALARVEKAEAERDAAILVHDYVRD